MNIFWRLWILWLLGYSSGLLVASGIETKQIGVVIVGWVLAGVGGWNIGSLRSRFLNRA